MKLALICVAAGRGERFGGDKLAVEIGGRTVLEMSVARLRAACPDADAVVVVPAERVEAWSRRLDAGGRSSVVVAGGPRRQDSVRLGIEAVPDADVAVVHDGARPLVHPEDVAAVLAALGEADGAVLCADMTDTVKRVNRSGAVLETVPRDTLRRAQTPQAFRIAALRSAWKRIGFDREWTDEAAMLEAIGARVVTVLARHPNPKLTTEADLELIRVLHESAGEESR